MTLPTPSLAQSLRLPCGVILPNRLAKSAMSETLGTTDNHPTAALVSLYRRWARGGIGLCITGNVMIDRRALGEPNNVVIEDESDLEILKQWASAGTENGTQLWMQLNHPGKQSPKGLNIENVSPSAVPFGPKMAPFFAPPRELREEEILEIIKRFGRAAEIAKKAGFSGVQIHGAHGYLVSQFLSPRHNLRTDQWGGTEENRMRFPLEVLKEMRRNVGPEFPIGIKLNSADFQRGGFEEAESIRVIAALAREGIDLVEISGGTYEAPVMMGSKPVKSSTAQREAYFLEFAEKARASVKVPLMVTGGFRSAQGMASAISTGSVDLIGLARLLAVEPDVPHRVLEGLDPLQTIRPIKTGIRRIDEMGFMEITWYTRQLARMGNGQEPKPHDPAFKAFLANVMNLGWRSFKSRRLRARD